jgi:hypothetical protein
LIYSHLRAWLKASRAKKKKFNEMFAELKRALGVNDEDVDFDPDFAKLSIISH